MSGRHGVFVCVQPLGVGQYTFENGIVQEGEFVVDEAVPDDDSKQGDEDTKPELKTKWAGGVILPRAR